MRSAAAPGRGGRPKSFTLVELLVVMLIIAILAGIILSAGEGAMTSAARSRARAEIQAMSTGLESYKTDNGIYPSNTLDETNNYANYDGSSSSGPYTTSAELLYQSLSGKSNFLDASFTAGKGYMTFKANQVGSTNSGTASYVEDPFGYSYAYNTGNTTDPATTPYNGAGFFDLWSTGGALTSTPNPTNSWINNWSQ